MLNRVKHRCWYNVLAGVLVYLVRNCGYVSTQRPNGTESRDKLLLDLEATGLWL